MKILVACEESQAVTIELRKLGHEAFSCDIIPCSGNHPEWHIQQDVLPLLDGDCAFKTGDGTLHLTSGKWDMIIAFPPCTYLSKAGARRLYPQAGTIDETRYQQGLAAKDFFMRFYNADCDKIAIENPVSLRIFDMPKHTQEVQPYMFGHPYTKMTRLWLKGLPQLAPTNTVIPQGPYIPSLTGRKDRSKYGAPRCGGSSKARSKTFPGIAKAMAQQWAGKDTTP